ncbi:MAG: HD domain-containing protein, partial [Myxococcales bacterium]|nr:HD domain-containing protein [Myxococcales bacterium]
MRSPVSELRVDLRQMILAVETTMDLVGLADPNHGKRVGYIAARIARQLGANPEEVELAFDLGLMHDCGVSTGIEREALREYFDWEDAHVHGEVGYQLLKGLAPLARFAVPIRHHHTHWSELEGLAGVSPEDARLANLIFLADRVDVMAASHYGVDILLARDDIVARVRGLRGSFFAPDLVDAFVRAEASEAFWIALEDRHITRYAWELGMKGSTEFLN